MSGKCFRAVIVAVLLAVALSVASPATAVPAGMIATECGSTASGGG